MPEFSIGFVAYFAVVGLIAYYAYTKTKTGFDYDLGGRKLTAPVSALSAGASDMSGWLLLGLPGAIYIGGFTESWIAIGLLIGAFLNWHYVAPRLRFLCTAYEEQVHTLPQLFSLRTEHNSIALRLVSSLVVIVFFTIYTSAGFVAAAKLSVNVLGWDYQTGVLVGATITMLYTMVGGFLAVSWTDTFQALLMITALVVIPVIALSSIDVASVDLSFKTVGFVSTLSLLAWGLGYFGQPHILARFMAIKDQSEVPKAKRIGMSWMLITSLGAVAVALVGAVHLPDLADPETVFIDLAQVLLNPWVAGFLIAAILAAVMSTVDSQLIVASTAIVHDLFRIQKRRLLTSRFVVLGVAVIACLIALDENSVILNIVAYAWAGLGASFGPCVLFCCYWRGTTGQGLVAGMLVGAITTIVWYNLGLAYPDSFGAIYEIIPAFLAACLAIYLVSLTRLGVEPESAAYALEEFKDSSSVRASE